MFSVWNYPVSLLVMVLFPLVFVPTVSYMMFIVLSLRHRLLRHFCHTVMLPYYCQVLLLPVLCHLYCPPVRLASSLILPVVCLVLMFLRVVPVMSVVVLNLPCRPRLLCYQSVLPLLSLFRPVRLPFHPVQLLFPVLLFRPVPFPVLLFRPVLV